MTPDNIDPLRKGEAYESAPAAGSWIGRRIGTYEFLSLAGVGGMGEVYRAHDSKLKREVAIKVLPEEFARDSERSSRFQREAQILASLNHPNIASIYNLEESGGLRFLILELVEGETLDQRLKRGRIPLHDALRIATQLAEALGAAHERAILHRDLKPSNIKLTPEGIVKVLDFGLAKVLPAETLDPSEAVTNLAVSEAGMILGTPLYMSPEQACGKDAARTWDVWAFGCVLYEMLAGCPVFDGRTTGEILAGVLKTEPDWNRLPVDTPQSIRRLLRRCLEKDAHRRLRDLRDARLEIDEAEMPAAADVPPAASGPRRRERLAWIVAGVCLVALVGALTFRRTGVLNPPTEDARTYRASIALPEGLRFPADQSPAGRFALSPNGRRIAFAVIDATGHSTLWVRQLDTLIAQPLAGTDGAAFPFWSPDSRFLAFLAQGQLKTIEASGGVPLTLADATLGATGTWSRDNVILFTPNGGSSLYRVSASGGDMPSPVTTLDAANGDVQHWYPFFLPDRRHFLYSTLRSKTGGAKGPAGVYVGSLDPKEAATLLLEDGFNAKYAQGYVLFLRGNTLMAREFDPTRLELKGEAAPLAARIQTLAGSVTGTAGAFSVADSGLLAYQSGLEAVRSQLVWFDRAGKSTAMLGDPADYGDVALSPDDRHAAVSVLDPARRTRDVWIYDLAQGRRQPFTSDPANEISPIYSPDSSEIAFSRQDSKRVDLFKRPVMGPGNETLLQEGSLGKFSQSWSRDGRFILYVAGGAAINRSDLWFLPLFGDKKPVEFLATPFVENQGQFSPDGKWVAYLSNKTGPYEIYVTSFPVPGVEHLVSTAGGMWPRWRADGGEIFYVTDTSLNAAEVRSGPSGVEVGRAHQLFPLHPRPMVSLGEFPYDVSRDGRFLVNTFVEETTSIPITLFINWTADAKK